MSRVKNKDAWDKLEAEKDKRRTLKGLSQTAREGDSNSTRLMIDYSARIISLSEDIPEDVKLYIYDSFRMILNGEEPNKVFNINKKKNKFHMELRDSTLARCVDYHIRQGLSEDDAIEYVLNNTPPFGEIERKLGFDGIRTAYRKYYIHVKREK
ncbi:MAG: hypothetical protein KUF72_12510 [Candidatus Thiodiazotropha sp. (ex Ctena orbiculata)]|nr:hypothetical protein [Candidatus Thiodiazotropha taylori]